MEKKSNKHVIDLIAHIAILTFTLLLIILTSVWLSKVYKATAEDVNRLKSLRIAVTVFFALDLLLVLGEVVCGSATHFKANAAFIFRFVMQILALLNVVIAFVLVCILSGNESTLDLYTTYATYSVINSTVAFVFMLISAGITLKMPCEATVANN